MLGNVRETLDANADEYGDAPATQLRIDDDEGGHGELGMTTACKTLAAYGYDAYQQLSIAEIQREMPRGIPTGDAKGDTWEIPTTERRCEEAGAPQLLSSDVLRQSNQSSGVFTVP